MSSADHDLQYATELLDRERQIIATEQAGERAEMALKRMKQSMDNGLHALYNAVERGNDISEDVLSELHKNQRAMNVGNAAAFFQRHNISKNVKNISDAFK